MAAALGEIAVLSPAPKTVAAAQAEADPLPRIKTLRDEGRLAAALAVATEALARESERRDLRIERGFLLPTLLQSA